MKDVIKETLEFSLKNGEVIADFWAFSEKVTFEGFLPRLHTNCNTFAVNAVISIQEKKVFSLSEKTLWQKDKDGNFLY